MHQVASKTGFGKSTVQEISKELKGSKENYKPGHPSKLSSGDKRMIIHQITSG
jgi:transposase